MFYLTDYFGLKYQEGRAFNSYTAAIKAAQRIPEDRRTLGVLVVNSADEDDCDIVFSPALGPLH